MSDSKRCSHLLTTVCAASVLALALARPARCVDTLNFPPSEFDILNPTTGRNIGHGRYTVDRVSGGVVLHGENHYLTGEHDVEEDKMVATEESSLPILTEFRHSFYNADGSLYLEGRLDISSGLGSCARGARGSINVQSEQFQFPGDTYAGSSLLIPIQDFLTRTQANGSLRLHAFNCAPGPKLLSVEIQSQPQTEAWAYYPGDLQKIDIQADFGFWNILIRPFIPKLAAWFDPSNRWLLVGAQLERYYRGPKIILVRARDASALGAADAQKMPSVAGAPPP